MFITNNSQIILMNLCNLILKKEEFPILHETCFQIPIHPKLLDENIFINDKIAKNIFPQVAEDWSKELQRKFPQGWDSVYQTEENGLVTGFQISRNYGGGIYFNKDDFNCRAFGKTYINFSEEKWNEFKFDKDKKQIYVYASENIDNFGGALFLRNWVIKYMNEVFKEIHYLL